MGEILQPDRAARLAEAKAIDPDALSLDEVLAAVINHTWKSPAQQGFAGSAQRAIAVAVASFRFSRAPARRVRPWLYAERTWLRRTIWLIGTERTHHTQEWQDAYAFATHAIAAVERGNTNVQDCPS